MATYLSLGKLHPPKQRGGEGGAGHRRNQCCNSDYSIQWVPGMFWRLQPCKISRSVGCENAQHMRALLVSIVV